MVEKEGIKQKKRGLELLYIDTQRTQRGRPGQDRAEETPHVNWPPMMPGNMTWDA